MDQDLVVLFCQAAAAPIYPNVMEQFLSARRKKVEDRSYNNAQ
jgi:hypothetical protein